MVKEVVRKSSDKKLNYMKGYIQRPSVKKHRQEYMKNWYKNNKQQQSVFMKNWRKNKKEYMKDYERNKRPNKDVRSKKSKYRQRRWRKTKKGKLANLRHCNKRRNNLGFNIILPNILDEPFEYHHIDDENVIPLPKDIHKFFFNQDKSVHRENLKPIIEQLYDIEI